jgi:hypothetical protein
LTKIPQSDMKNNYSEDEQTKEFNLSHDGTMRE